MSKLVILQATSYMPDNQIRILTSLVHPPAIAIETGTPDSWVDIEAQIGTELPLDYKQLINTYGTGDFFHFLGILSPFCRTTSLMSANQFLQESYPNGNWYEWMPLFPAPGGLLQCGGDENGNLLFWRTQGTPDSWLLAYASGDGIDFELIDLPLVAYLVAWVKREISPQILEGNSLLEQDGCIFKPWEYPIE